MVALILCSTKLLHIFDAQVVTNYEDLLSQATGIEALESKSMHVIASFLCVLNPIPRPHV